jgi:uncharacterized OsmC-like protein
MSPPTPEEIKLFAIGGHNCTTLASRMYADRTGISVDEARTRLRSVVADSREWMERVGPALPYVTPEELS